MILGLSDYSQSAKVIEYMVINYQQFIITHPSRHPASALEPAPLPQLPTVYSPAQLYLNLVRSKSTVNSSAKSDEDHRRSSTLAIGISGLRMFFFVLKVLIFFRN